jgi:hypothetical protein
VREKREVIRDNWLEKGQGRCTEGSSVICEVYTRGRASKGNQLVMGTVVYAITPSSPLSLRNI